MLAFGIGNPADWAIIFVLALIVFGPKKLPELGQQLGQALREFRKVADDFTGATDNIRNEVVGVGNVFRGPLNDVHAAITGSVPPPRQPGDLPRPAVVPVESPAAVAQPGALPGIRGLRISTAVPEDETALDGENGRQ